MAGEQQAAAMRAGIDRLFNARSLAVVGVSAEATKLSSMPISAMLNLGYKGAVTGVNPRYDRVGPWPCVARVEDLPPGIEAAVSVLPAEAAVVAARALAERGVKALVIVAQGFGESGPAGKLRDAELEEISRTHGMAICGPNSNGLANVANGLALSFAPILQYKDTVRPGRFAIVSQSGAMISTLVAKCAARGVGIGKIVSCGNELILSMADYVDYIADDPDSDALMLFIETIRNPPALRAALARCRAAGKRVVAMKVGESDGGQKAALSHTGAIAGSYRNTLAFLRREGVAVTDEIDALAALMELTMRYPGAFGQPSKPAMASISGGYAAVTADTIARLGMPFQDPSPAAAAELAALPNQSHPVNPYDIAAQNQLIPAIFDIFRRDGFNQFLFGLVPLAPPIRRGVIAMIKAATGTVFDQMHALAPGLPADEVAELQAAGVCVSESLPPLLAALRAMAEAAPPGLAAGASRPRPEIGTLPAGAGLLDEAASKALIARLGIAAPQSRILRGAPDLAALAGLRRPLVIKGLSETIAHKSEHGLVALDLRSDAELLEAWARVRAALAKADPEAESLLAEEMLGGGLEAIIGLQRDPIVGPAVVIGAGGVLVELLDDAVVLLPPFDADAVRAALAGTKFGRLLAGYRGRSYDIDALCAAAVAIGDLALAEPRLDSIDINPVLVRAPGDGIAALDAKVFLRAA